MKKLTFLLLAVFLANGQQQKTPITIESIFNESSMVFSGQVVDKQSYWDVDRKMIYTVHKVKVSKSFKGNQNEFQYVVSKGGTVGLQGVVIKPSVTIDKKSYGYFMVKMAAPLQLEGFNKSNLLTEMIHTTASYYDYDRITDIVNIPNQNHLSKQNFEKKLKLFSKKKEIVLDDFFQSIYLKQQAVVNDIEISSLSPASIVAGNKEILTITGSGFGDFTSGSSYGVVSFKNSDSGGSTWKTCLKTQIVSWTDTQIRVEVPSDSGSGSIRITTAADIDYESMQTIEIPYSINTLNYPSNGSDDEIFEYPIFHTGSSLEDILDSESNPYDNISNGQYVFTLNQDFYDNEKAKNSFEEGLIDWVCTTGLNFAIGDDTTTINEAESDFTNVVTFATSNSLGTTISYFDGCVINDQDGNLAGVQISWREIDIIFNIITDWGFDEVDPNQYDFASTAKHELGHAMGFGHNINSTSLMHYASGRGPGATSIDDYLVGAEQILARNISTALCGTLDPHEISACSSIDPNLDTDQDGISDILDRCPDTPTNAEIDDFGCALSQLDSDEDGVTDDIDQCENTPFGAEVDSVGCADVDDDGVKDNVDLCPDTPQNEQADSNGCSPSQKDTDNDGVTDDFDQCADTPIEASVDAYGCSIFTLPADNFKVIVQSRSCPDSNDGLIEIRALDKSFTYEVSVGEQTISLSSENAYEYTFNELEVGTYDICFSIIEEPSFEQCFQINLTQPDSLNVYDSFSGDNVLFQLQGSTSYNVNHNGNLWVLENDTMELSLDKGLNKVLISTDLECQGIFEKQYFNSEEVLVYPTVVNDLINFVVGGSDPSVEIEIFDMNGKLLLKTIRNLENSRSMKLSLKDFSSGIYFAHLHSNTVNITSKIIKNE